MTPYIRALRAITATVFQRVYRPVVWVIGGILFVLVVVTTILGITVNAWWFMLYIALLPLTLIAVLAAVVLWLLSQKLQPRVITRAERQTIHAFSDKVLRVAEVRSTPWPIMALLVAKDIARGKKSSYIENIINDSSSLKQDFVAIRNLFI